MTGRGFDHTRGRGRGRGRGDAPLPYRGRGGFGRGRCGPPEVQVFSHPDHHNPRLNSLVQRTENETQIAAQQRPSLGTKGGAVDERRLPQRPAYGSQGREIMLWANYFEMITQENLLLFRYSVEVLPDEAGRKPVGRKLRRIIELLIENHFPPYRQSIATDYRANLICSSDLPIDQEPYTVVYRADGEDDPPPNAKKYLVQLRDTGMFRVSELMDYLTSAHASALFGSKEDIIQALNIVVGQYPKATSTIFTVGANKHFEVAATGQEAMSLDSGLKALRGFFVSVRAATSRILVNVQVKHGAVYNEGPLPELMTAHLDHNGQNLYKLAQFLNGVRIKVTHIVKRDKQGREIPRIKTIAALASPGDGQNQACPPRVPRFGAGAKQVEFFLNLAADTQVGKQGPAVGNQKRGKNAGKAGIGPWPPQGQYISVHDFFQQTYGITTRHPNKPVVNVATRQNPSYLPADVCVVVPGQISKTQLSPTQTAQMIRFAVRRPAQNAQSIVTNGARVLGISPSTNTVLQNFGISITPHLITVPGRILKAPDVKYRSGTTANARAGSWNMQSLQLSTGSSLHSWTYLWISVEGSRDAWQNIDELRATLDAFQSKLKLSGIDIRPYVSGQKVEVTPANANSKIDEAITKFVSHPLRPSPKLILVILPQVNTHIYNRVKFICDVKVGLLNVCIVGSKFAKDRNDQYFANVALKFNLKLGGRNQILDISKLGIIREGKTMVVGIDVTHPSPGSSARAPSVAGIVASIDQWLSQWPADLQIQKARKEMVSGLDGMLQSRLQLWAKNNKGALPENILVYRDGVSEGQYDIALDEELPLLRKACTAVYTAAGKALPAISIIIVGKRHHTRFYPQKTDDADRSSNPPNGTVVDRGVTEARNWDFFLQAHTALQGTARPAHYFIVHDEIFSRLRYGVGSSGGGGPARQRPAALMMPQQPFQNAADAVEDLTHNMCYLFGRATKAVSICPAAYYADLVCDRARCYLSGVFDPSSPGVTPAGSVADGSGGDDPRPEDVRIHEKVRDSMFYI